MLSGTYRHVSNALMRKFHFCFAYLAIWNKQENPSLKAIFLLLRLEADRLPPAAGGGVLFIIYEFGFLRQNLYRAAQSILETGQTAVCKCCQAGGSEQKAFPIL